ncbi:deaminase domain-containing protein [Romboutsia lituseburensis]|uniref:deaminase domain-containing protein n=1 Tax=Romboutsia lituseburensis TaxID=1537 RepID=UPI00215A4732|nr:deaminase domain-containing protein [Romboutsia lituseburensis]MCR8746238.1 hypothetical protein [Romboutsia lituseburensis]
MTEICNTSNNRKKQRLKINNINDLKDALRKEGYKEINLEDINFKENIAKIFKIDNPVIDIMYESLNNNDITYRADNANNFIEYMKNIKLFQNEHIKLSKKINKIRKLNISRVEYERIVSTQDNVDHMLNDIEKIKIIVSKKINPKDIYKLENLEKQLDKDYIYAKDIELLKKMIGTGRGNKIEVYNHDTKTKTISIEIPDEMNYEYIPAKLGSIEYHNHIKNNIPRMKRLRRNIHKYMVVNEEDNQIFNINQTKTLQDTINIAIAIYDNKEFKAISGSNDVAEFCTAPKDKDANFKSSKVNKLGKLGIGYNRVNDSEKKIFEEIHNQIESGKIKDYGNLTLYSKWEPCPSCYHVISQFCEKHKNINVQVKYSKEYGE